MNIKKIKNWLKEKIDKTSGAHSFLYSYALLKVNTLEFDEFLNWLKDTQQFSKGIVKTIMRNISNFIESQKKE